MSDSGADEELTPSTRKKLGTPLEWTTVEIYNTEDEVDTYFRYKQDFKTVASHGNENPRCRLCDDYRIKHVSVE